MSFEAFEKSITSSALKRVAKHWNDARGQNKLPAWKAINPAAIVSELPMVWTYNYNRASDTFTGRLSGRYIDEIFGRNLKGVPMRDLYPESEYLRLFERSKRVVTEPAFYHGEGMVFTHKDRFGHGERIMMPMGNDGVTGDGIFGATDYQSFFGKPTEHRPEAESWFAL